VHLCYHVGIYVHAHACLYLSALMNLVAMPGPMEPRPSTDTWGRSVKVRGLVHLEQGSCWSITAAFGEAFATQWRYLDRPKDAFSGRVVDFHRLAQPFDVNLRARGNYHRTHGYDVNFVATGHRIVWVCKGGPLGPSIVFAMCFYTWTSWVKVCVSLHPALLFWGRAGVCGRLAESRCPSVAGLRADLVFGRHYFRLPLNKITQRSWL
jgi:hypothetical protein